ncbi:MAG: hypothetical protein OXE76_08995 [Alphaproteobacteria bacterium]|nr:hypothetical protein [Alphaproteobacteria bacterium]
MLSPFPKHVLSFALTVMIGLLAGCGGGGGGGDPTPSSPANPQVRIAIPARALTIPSTGSVPVSADIRTRDGTIGIGPAYRHESPEMLTTGTVEGAFGIFSGRWRDSRGRDGSVAAHEIARLLRSAQSQTDREGGGQIVITSRPSGPDVLRLSSAARPDEREAVLAALRNINTARPWETRIRLGPVLAGDDPAVPANEIHVHFTNGTSTWPDRDYAPGILGIGGQFVGGVPRGGFAYIDRTAIDSHILREFVATHEILHATGFGVHVEEALYPDSIMSPEVDRGLAVVPRFYLTIDGEVDLVDLPEGPLPFPVTAGDLGVWEADAFHLLANHDDGEDDWLRFGAGYRNGLAKPWVWGREPAIRLEDNRALGTRATWRGELLGFTASGRTVAGKARIGVDLAAAAGQADFTELESWQKGAHPGSLGSGSRWGDLGYTLTLWQEGTRSGFGSAFAPGDDPGIVTGVFVGAAHEGAAGVLEHPDLSASFGAVR